MKNVGGITTPFVDSIVPVPGVEGDNTKTGGVPVRDGSKGIAPAEMPMVTGVNVRDDDTNPREAAKGIKGS